MKKKKYIVTLLIRQEYLVEGLNRREAFDATLNNMEGCYSAIIQSKKIKIYNNELRTNTNNK